MQSKRTGIDKAFHQIRQAVKRTHHGAHRNAESEQVLAHLHQLLSEASSDAAKSPSQGGRTSQGQETPYGVDGEETSDDDDDVDVAEGMGGAPTLLQHSEGSMAVDDAENPLQLLARASYIQPSPDSRYGKSPQSVQQVSVTSTDRSGQDLQTFFSTPRANLDVGEAIDPISLGLVSDEEADSLFALYACCSPLRGTPSDMCLVFTRGLLTRDGVWTLESTPPSLRGHVRRFSSHPSWPLRHFSWPPARLSPNASPTMRRSWLIVS